jgi:DNA-binding MarR family transcriptional regulator
MDTHPSEALTAEIEPGVITILRSLRQILRRVELGSHDLEVAHGVTQPQLICLRTLAQAGRSTQVELARAVHLSASTLVGILDRLEHKGLVLRTRDHQDRRRIFLSLTPAGREKVRVAPEPLHQRVQRALIGLDPAELATMASSLGRLVELLEARDVDATPILTSGPIPKPAALDGGPG